jgi:hypothetical protein
MSELRKKVVGGASDGADDGDVGNEGVEEEGCMYAKDEVYHEIIFLVCCFVMCLLPYVRDTRRWAWIDD